MIDALVVGAGPAGSTAARILATSGYEVLLVDKDEFPRDKVCGDGLIPDALNGLRRAGVYEEAAERGHLSDTLSVFSASGVRIDVQGVYLTLRRRELDHILLQAAVAAGATFRVGKISAIREDDDGVSAEVVDPTSRIHAQMALLATGADVTLAKQLGMVSSQPRPSAVAMRCYVRSPVACDQLVISFDRTIAPGYAWIFPLGNREYNVGCGFFYGGGAPKKPNLRQTFENFTTHFPLAAQVWEDRESTSKLAGAPLRCGLDTDLAFSGARTLAIGETIGATYPFTGEGVGKAIETGEIAATQIAAALETGSAEPLARFPQLLRERLGPRYTGYRIAQDWLARSWLGDFVARRVRQSPELQRTVADIVNEAADPLQLFSWRRLLPELMPWRSNR